MLNKKSGKKESSNDDMQYLVDEMGKIKSENTAFEAKISELQEEIKSLNRNIEYVDESLKDIYSKFGGDLNDLSDNIWTRMKLIFEFFQDRV